MNDKAQLESSSTIKTTASMKKKGKAAFSMFYQRIKMLDVLQKAQKNPKKHN